MGSNNKISVTILTKNSQKYLVECLSALKRFDEIVVLDNGSSDETIAISKSFPNVIVYEHDFIGFGPLKKLAVSLSSNNWILSVDSDEIFSEELIEEILNLNLNANYVYSILRDNYYNKKLVKCCGWDKDYVQRIFNKTKVDFNDKQVHEGLLFTKEIEVVLLKNTFKHYTFDSAEELIQKMNSYSTLYSNEHFENKYSSPVVAIIKSIFAFFKNYILQKGFLYGFEGLLISVSNSNGVFYKYIKLYERRKNK